MHDHPVDGQDLHRGCQAHAEGQVNQAECGELVWYVDDGAYSFVYSVPTVLSRVLTEKYNVLEEWMNNNN